MTGSQRSNLRAAGEGGALQPTLPLVLQITALVVLSAVPVVLFVLTFSALGDGADVHAELKERGGMVRGFAGAGFVVGIALYVLDASYWKGVWTKVKYSLLVAMFALLTVACLFSAGDYPSAPMCLFVVFSIIYLLGVHRALFRAAPQGEFLASLGMALAVVGVGVLIAFIGWASDDHRWPGDDKALKAEYNLKMGCECTPCNATVAAVANHDDCCQNFHCLAGFLLWSSPFIASLLSLGFGALLYFLGRTTRSKHTLHIGLRLFLGFVVLAILGMWVAASVSGAGMGLSNAVLMLAFVSVGVMGGVVVSIVGWADLKKDLLSIPLVARIMDSFLSDWVKALFVIMGTPLLVVYIALSFVNQFIRKRTPCTKELAPGEAELVLTATTHDQVQGMLQWDWTSVLQRVMYWALFFLTISVGVTKLTILFLSWLNEQLSSSLDLASVTFVFMLVGLVMFLLPPVPGVPVYLTGGVILGSAARGDLGFWGAVVYGSVVCLVVKFLAIVGQQKGIGERMSGSPRIRLMVGVNSVTIQAIRFILEQKGISAAKVFILIGGPDWPTSVLTGILRLSVFEMLLGSAPVYFLILPCVAAGAFQLRVGDGGVWGSLAPVTLSVAALVQMSAMIAALYFIEDCAAKHADELKARCNDQEVMELEEKIRLKQRVYKQETNWNKLPAWVKATMVVAAGCYGTSCWIIQLFGSRCFEEYEITDTVEARLGGSAWNIVLPLGRVALGFMAVGVACHLVFHFWAKRAVRLGATDMAHSLAEGASL